MQMDYASVWDNCLSTIRQHVNKQSFSTWFEPIKAVSLQGSALTIQVPNRFFYEWLEEHYVGLLKMTIRKELGANAQLLYQIVNPGARRDKPNKKQAALPVAVAAKDNERNRQGYAPGMVDTGHIKNPFIIPGIKKPNIDPQLNAKYTFATFIEGDCNQLARSAGLAIADRPGKNSFNPLIIYGDVGLGKTHLAHAIGHRVLELHPGKMVLYVATDKFTQQIIQSIKNNAVNDLINFYQFVDVLIVDDIQFLANKQKMQEIFFNIFNQLHQQGKQIILTSDRPPKDMEGIEERLISRFKWGLTADLGVPDLETRMAILESKSNREGVDIPANVTEFMCYHIKHNIRELEGALISLIARSSLNQREIDVNLAKEVIKNFVSEINREITVDYIQQLVAQHFELPVDSLQGKTRKRQVVIARQLSMYLAKKLTDQSLKAIGENFGGRDHSTVIYSCRTVQDLMETDAIFKDTVSELERKIKMHFDLAL
ncbi:MAG: chromosomal replication initiator protein DnaA [Bacteroidetes bacterium]|nr:MAG: chromosomal replication initiator protein DnaA [Bacteroidota bacterium]